jgi:outer membrane protein
MIQKLLLRINPVKLMNAIVSRSARRLAPGLALAALVLELAGCAHVTNRVQGVPLNSPSPAIPWTPPKRENLKPVPTQPAALDAQAGELIKRLTLAEAADIALQNNPATRISWNNARAAAAGYKASLGSLYPSVNVTGTYYSSKGPSYQSKPGVAEGASIVSATGTNAAVNLSFLLFDFGGRFASIEQSRQALLAADWTHNAVIQNVVLQTEAAFFGHMEARALLEANKTSLAEAEAGLNAAEERRRVGLATSADALQARTAYSEIKLAVQGTEGQVRVTKGALAAALGYPANSPFSFDLIDPGIPNASVTESVDRLVDRALAGRPDLQASRALDRESAAGVTRARSNLLPSVSFSGSAGRTWIEDVPGSTDNRSGSLLLQIPLFAGFSQQFNLSRAKAEAAAAQERTRAFEQSVILDVFSSHSDFITAGERLRTTDDLVASAAQSEEAALGRYKEGVGSILDLLSAQKSLAAARAEQINARLAWFTAFAQLAHDAGILGLHGDNPLAPASIYQEGQPR